MGCAQSNAADVSTTDVRVEDVSYTTAEKYVTGNFDFEEEEEPQPSAQELALAELAATERLVDFKSTLLSFKRQASIDRPANGGSQPMDASITRGDAFEEALKAALTWLGRTIIPSSLSARPWNSMDSTLHPGFHMAFGTWWPHALDHSTTRKLEPFWSSLAPAALEADRRGAPSEATARSAAYEAADVRWAGDDDNDLRAHAKAQGDFIFFMHSSNVHGRTDRAQLEDMRQANVEAALGRAAVYGSADIAASNAKPGKDGMVDWTKTDQAPLMRHVESDGVLRRLSMKRSVSSLLAQRPDALSREMSTKSKHERVGSSGSVSVSGDAASEAAPAPKDAKQKKKNREKNKLLKKMSSLQLPAFVRYGEQRRFEEDDA